MSRMIVLMLATVAVWASVAWVLTEMAGPDNGTILIMGIIAFLSTAVIWTVGGNVAVSQSPRTSRYEAFDRGDAKPKRTSGGDSLSSVVDTLTPEQIAALDIALQRRRDSFDEDDQILANRLAAEMEHRSRSNS